MMDVQALKEDIKRRVPALSPSNVFVRDPPVRRGRRPRRVVKSEPNAFVLAMQSLARCETDEALRLATIALLDSPEWRRALALLHQRAFTAGVLGALAQAQQPTVVEQLSSTDDLPVPFAERITPATRRTGQLTMLWTIRTTVELLQSGCARPQRATNDAPFSYLYDRTIPREVRRMLRLRDMSDAAFFALAATDLAAAQLTDASINSLYRAWTNNSGQWFDYVATFFDIAVPRKLRTPVDWMAALTQHAAERNGAVLASQARTPFLIPVDDD